MQNILTKYIELKSVGNYKIWQCLKLFAVFAIFCANTIYTHLDTVMLGFMKINENVDLYNDAVSIKIIIFSIVTSLGMFCFQDLHTTLNKV